jgi:hypothetical protein
VNWVVIFWCNLFVITSLLSAIRSCDLDLVRVGEVWSGAVVKVRNQSERRPGLVARGFEVV